MTVTLHSQGWAYVLYCLYFLVFFLSQLAFSLEVILIYQKVEVEEVLTSTATLVLICANFRHLTLRCSLFLFFTVLIKESREVPRCLLLPKSPQEFLCLHQRLLLPWFFSLIMLYFLHFWQLLWQLSLSFIFFRRSIT